MFALWHIHVNKISIEVDIFNFLRFKKCYATLKSQNSQTIHVRLEKQDIFKHEPNSPS